MRHGSARRSGGSVQVGGQTAYQTRRARRGVARLPSPRRGRRARGPAPSRPSGRSLLVRSGRPAHRRGPARGGEPYLSLSCLRASRTTFVAACELRGVPTSSTGIMTLLFLMLAFIIRSHPLGIENGKYTLSQVVSCCVSYSYTWVRLGLVGRLHLRWIRQWPPLVRSCANRTFMVFMPSTNSPVGL